MVGMLLLYPKQRTSSFNSNNRGKERDTSSPSGREDRALLGQSPREEGLCVPLRDQRASVPDAVWCNRASIPKGYMDLVNDFLNWDSPHHSLSFLTNPTLTIQGPCSAPD